MKTEKLFEDSPGPKLSVPDMPWIGGRVEQQLDALYATDTAWETVPVRTTVMIAAPSASEAVYVGCENAMTEKSLSLMLIDSDEGYDSRYPSVAQERATEKLLGGVKT